MVNIMNINDNDTVLTFGFTAGALFDMKEAEAVFESHSEEDRLSAYNEYFAQMNAEGKVFKPGPALGFYISLIKLRNSRKVPCDVAKFRFGMSARFDTNHAGAITLMNSIDHYLLDEVNDFVPDYISWTGGLEQASSHKMQGADVVFTSSDASAKEYHKRGVAAVHIQNISEIQNMKMFNNRDNKINFICDFDGVIVDPTSEMVYQAAKQIKGLEPLEEFRLNEIKHRHTPMELGPLGVVVQKLSRVVAYFNKKMLANEIKANDIPLATTILTARGGAASMRIVKTMAHHNIQVTRADFADGRPKHIALSMLDESHINLFLEDSLVHVDGARNNVSHVLAGLVFNDFTSGDMSLNGAVEQLRARA